MIVERDDYKVEEVQREREIEDEFGACVDQDLCNYPATRNIISIPHERGVRRRTNMKMLQSNHTIPSVHPTALSARTLRDENTRSSENG